MITIVVWNLRWNFRGRLIYHRAGAAESVASGSFGIDYLELFNISERAPTININLYGYKLK